MGLFVILAMNPTMEKMTKPANMLVKELMQQTMTESLYGRDKAQGSHCHAYINSLSTRHTLSREAWGEGTIDSHFAVAQQLNTLILRCFLKKTVSFVSFNIVVTIDVCDHLKQYETKPDPKICK